MVYRFGSVLIKEGKWYVAHCVELGVASQGKTVEEAQKNLQEAVELYLEDYPKSRLRQFAKEAPLFSTFTWNTKKCFEVGEN